MASENSPPSDPLPLSEDLATKAINKRYEGLVMVRTKAIKGKGAWYWVHLEPILIQNPNTNLPKAVKLKCTLCNSVFSASNPSRTATEHLKRGTCPNFNSILRPNSSLSPLPLSTLPPLSSYNPRKRSSQMGTSPSTTPSPPAVSTSLEGHSLPIVESRYSSELGYSPGQNPAGTASYSGLFQNHLMLSGGKEDLGALAMLENSVKKLKSPQAFQCPTLSKEHIDSALELLAEWFYESCGSVSLTSLELPKFRAFLNQLGLPAVSKRELLGARLDSKFNDAKAESEARIRDAMFFQLASSGWKRNSSSGFQCGEEDSVKFIVNLPNRTSVFQKVVLKGGPVSSEYAEEIMWDTITGICGNPVQRCVGIVADKYNDKALRNLEIENHWMVNVSCQLQGFISLIKDFNKEFSLFRIVTEKCLKVANFINSESGIKKVLQKYKMQELDCFELLRVPSPKCDTSKNFTSVYAMLDEVLSCARLLHMVVLDDSCKATFMEDQVAREVAEIIQSDAFWNQLEAIYSLVKLIKDMAREIESERPLIGQCLPLWEDLRTKIKHWCAKFGIAEGTVEKIVEKRFRKNYHPAWAAAFILDPLYLIKDTSGKYLPPFRLLTPEQEKDVDKLITRLVTREEAHVALMELMKWRSEGLDPLYAQAVQIRQLDAVTGKMKIANPQSSRLVWETCLSEFKSLGKVAVRLIFLQATACRFKCNWSFINWVSMHRHSRIGLERAQKMIFIAAHAKLQRREHCNEEEKDAELFATAGHEDDVPNEGPS